MELSIRKINGTILYEKYSTLFDDSPDLSDRISDETVNTWQQDRLEKEKRSDTKQGKQAETIVQHYINESTSCKYISYDLIRNDEYKRHAPFDGLLYLRGSVTRETGNRMLDTIRAEVQKLGYGYLTPETRELLRANKLYTVEVKSTKVSDRKKEIAWKKRYCYPKEEDIIKVIKDSDDYLTYPKEIRHGSLENTREYRVLLCKKGIIPEGASFDQANKAMREHELPHMADFYFRVYLDTSEEKAYLLGFIIRQDFFSQGRPLIKKMVKPGKSEEAIYLSLPLSMGRELEALEEIVCAYPNIF